MLQVIRECEKMIAEQETNLNLSCLLPSFSRYLPCLFGTIVSLVSCNLVHEIVQINEQ